jgi:hypothetical protein
MQDNSVIRCKKAVNPANHAHIELIECLKPALQFSINSQSKYLPECFSFVVLASYLAFKVIRLLLGGYFNGGKAKPFRYHLYYTDRKLTGGKFFD